MKLKPQAKLKAKVVKRKRFQQLAIVHFNNCGPSVMLYQSFKPITIDKVAAQLEETDGFNEDRDSLTFVSAPTKQRI